MIDEIEMDILPIKKYYSCCGLYCSDYQKHINTKSHKLKMVDRDIFDLQNYNSKLRKDIEDIDKQKTILNRVILRNDLKINELKEEIKRILIS